MATELEELVEFLHHGNTQIRQIAIENLVGFSKAQPSLFKTSQLRPISDLKLLVRDYDPISKNALTILINLSEDAEVLKNLVNDDAFLETLLLRTTNEKEIHADDMSMLFANLAKADDMIKILKLKRSIPKSLSTSDLAIDQLMDCFVKGAEGGFNEKANFDYLAYFFADLAKHPECRSYFTKPQSHDNNIVPLTKITVFTEHKSLIRRLGAAATIKNVSFDVHSHQMLLASTGDNAVNILPYLLLPIMGPEEYSQEDTEGMLEDLQLLPPDKEREKDPEIIKTHLETLLLLTTEREGRDLMREVKVYPIVRETHAHVEDEGVREACDRLVQVIMRDEEGEGTDEVPKIAEIEEDEDDQLVDIV